MESPPRLEVLLLLGLVCWCGVTAELASSQRLQHPDENEVVQRDSPDDPLEGIFNECLSKWSFPCIQRKVLVFVDRIGRMKEISLIGDFLSIVRVGKEGGTPITEAGLQARLLPGEEDAISGLLQHTVSSFLESHVLRFSLPSGVTATLGGEARSAGNVVDVNLARAVGEARKKMKMKGMKMMMMMMMGKGAILGKIMMLLVKVKVMKALFLSILALILSKIQLFKSLMKSKGGMMKGGKETVIIIKGGGKGGGGGYSSGPPSGGGWSDGGGGGGGWSGGGGGGGAGWSSGGGGGGGGGWDSSGGGGAGGGGGGYPSSGGGGGWSSGGGGGGGDSYGGGASSGWSGGGGGSSGGWAGGGGGGGGGGGWSRHYDPTWLVYRTPTNNKSET